MHIFIRTPEIDISELESLFSVTMPNMEAKRQRQQQHPSVATKQEKVHLVLLSIPICATVLILVVK
jgi:hypothetical protein